MNELAHTVISAWSRTYFTEPILLSLLAITLIKSLTQRKNIEHLTLLPIYSSLFILMFAIDYVMTSRIISDRNYFSITLWSAQYLVSIVEFLTFMLYINFHTYSKANKLILKILSGLVLSLFVITYILYFRKPAIPRYFILHWLYVCQSIPILAGCIIFFTQLVRITTEFPVINRASFWVITGLSLYTICTLPISIAAPFILNKDYDLYNVLFTLIYIFYIILFIFILKAYKCKPAGLK